MKKTVILSVVASTMIMAGGDIAPLAPVVVQVEPEVSNWKFSAEAVGYYQTLGNASGGILGAGSGADDLFSQENAAANIGVRVHGVNENLFAGIGAGFEVLGLGTLGLEDSLVTDVMQTGAGQLNSAAWTQGYLTYGIGNTGIKVGRQTLPKGLSPFAFSESWNVFQNTFEAALVVNSDIQDTTIVYAFVNRANDHNNLGNFNNISAAGGAANANNGVHLLTAQNKSIDGLTLTGSYYLAPEMLGAANDVSIIWGDAQFSVSDYTIGIQGGTILGANDANAALNDTVALGAQVGAQFGMFNFAGAYTNVDDGTVAVRNLATTSGYAESALYTQMLANVNHISNDNDTFVVKASADVLGGNIGVAYGSTRDNRIANSDYQELDVVYTTSISENVTLLAAYIHFNDESMTESDNAVRVWGRYNF